MAGNGTGSPVSFVCPVARRHQWKDENHPSYPSRASWRYPSGHARIVRTGRRKPNTGKRGLRMLGIRHEYRCECGHVGWSAHVDMMRYPITETVPTETVRQRIPGGGSFISG